MKSETIILFIVDFTIYRTIKDIKKEKTKMKIETIRKKPTWEIKAMIKALSQPISSFLNTDEDNERLENCKLVLNERKK